MARATEQIERDLDRIQSAGAKLGTELEQVYLDYFQTFSIAVKQQAIQACYYICTRSYPEQFLQLTTSGRSHLMKAIQRSIQNSLDHLGEQITGENDTNSAQINERKFSNPADIERWHESIDRSIRLTLKGVSHKTNLLLVQSKVLPTGMPQGILAASAAAEERGDRIQNVPHTISALMEVDRAEAEEEIEPSDELDAEEEEDRLNFPFPNLVKIYAIFMRLMEIELGDLTTMGHRQKIDRLAAEIKSLSREYRRKQAELTTAAAAAAWQDSWRALEQKD
jgi:hypothetical protein